MTPHDTSDKHAKEILSALLPLLSGDDAIKTDFAVIEKNDTICLYRGSIKKCAHIDAIESIARENNAPILFALPYGAIKERGFDTHTNDEADILTLIPEKSVLTTSRTSFMAVLKAFITQNDLSLNTGIIEPSISDDDFEDLVRTIQKDHIATGDATQVVISRSFKSQFKDFNPRDLLRLYHDLLISRGQYMTIFMSNHADQHFLMAATPECHIEITKDRQTMIPIAGTFRKYDAHVTQPETEKDFEARLKEFLTDDKEINELFQVVDEEMKMMAEISPNGGKITGPYLREIGAVIHTEYHLNGQRSLDKNGQPLTRALDHLKTALHAPTVIGGPMESAARLVARYEPEGRRYYSGEIGFYDPEHDTIDAAIFLRGIEVYHDGRFSVQAGAGIVRDSDPHSERTETHAKASSVLRLLDHTNKNSYTQKLTPEMAQRLEPTLNARNDNLSNFWMMTQTPPKSSPILKGLTVTIINNEDNFAHMIGHVLRHHGCDITLTDTYDFNPDNDVSKLVVIGPGPGDINDLNNARMVTLNTHIDRLFNQGRLMIGVCLGHQAIAQYKGFDIVQQAKPTQGVARHVNIFGQSYMLGFYNSFAPKESENTAHFNGDIDYDADGYVLALHGDHYASFQCHPESILSQKGHGVLTQSLIKLVLSRQ